MKILLYSEGKNVFNKSGVGKALEHQKRALSYNGVQFTLDPEDEFDLAHINTIGLKSDEIMKKCRKKNIPTICHTHTTFEDFRNSFAFSNIISPLVKKRVVKLYGTADYLIAPSDYTKDVVEGYGIDNPIEVVSNGVDCTKFSKNEELAEKFKKEYNITTPVIICVGLPFERKGIFDFCRVAESFPDYRFLWFGAKITTILPKNVRDLLSDPPKNVMFPGFVPEETILGAYSCADAFLFMSYEENEGIAVLEALSMECPVIVRDIPVYRTWLSHGKNCHKAKDIKGFINLMNDVTELKSTIGNGRKVAEERDLKLVGERLKNIYGKLINN